MILLQSMRPSQTWGWYGRGRNGQPGEWDEVARHAGVDRGDGTVSTYEIGGCALIAGRNGRLRMSVRGGLSSLFGTVEVRARGFRPAGVR